MDVWRDERGAGAVTDAEYMSTLEYMWAGWPEPPDEDHDWEFVEIWYWPKEYVFGANWERPLPPMVGWSTAAVNL